jgi:hypothetical protein
LSCRPARAPPRRPLPAVDPFRLADEETSPVDVRLDADAGEGARRRAGGDRERALAGGGDDRLGERMLACRLGGGGKRSSSCA